MGGGHSLHLELKQASEEGLCVLERTELFQKERDMKVDTPFSVVSTGLSSLVGGLKGVGQVHIANQFTPGALDNLMEVGRFRERLQRCEGLVIGTRDTESRAQLDFQDSDACVAEGG